MRFGQFKDCPAPHEPCFDFGRAALPRRLSIGAAQQRSPTKMVFKVTKHVKFRKGVTQVPCQRCAAFMPLQCGICEDTPIVPMTLDVPTLRRNKFRDPRFMRTRRVKFRTVATHEHCHDIGRATLLRRLSIGAAQQRSPTNKGFTGTKHVKFRKGVTLVPCERCAAFMPLQCGICERIPIVPMTLNMPTLKRNKFRDPRLMRTRRVNFRTAATQEPYRDFGRAALPSRLNENEIHSHNSCASD